MNPWTDKELRKNKVSDDEVSHIVAGIDGQGNAGILVTCRCEFDAYRIRRMINRSGGRCMVVPYTKGDTYDSEDIQAFFNKRY